jgi:hypothetical protein
VGAGLTTSLLAAAAPQAAFAQQDQDRRYDDRDDDRDDRRADRDERDRRESYSRDEIIRAGSDFLGVTAEAIGGAIERISRDYGSHPDAYIAGSEVSASLVGGLRYGKGVVYKKNRPPRTVFWQGPSVGFDWGGNAARSFTLCYNLRDDEELFQRFPGVDGSAYLVGGLGVNYQRADEITLAPIRAGVGLRLGASVGYLAYTRSRHILPF